MITMYTVSSVYHGLLPCTAKKVMQIIDHCTIYLLIAGTYTPVVLTAIRPLYPQLGWGLFAVEWLLAAVATTLTAIDLKKYNVFSMICYIGMGWGIVFFLPQTIEAVGRGGFSFLLAGGIAYTIGAVLYGIGSRRKWMHSVFHIFVVLGSFLQFLAVYLYVI
jgi:hemolysin III